MLTKLAHKPSEIDERLEHYLHQMSQADADDAGVSAVAFPEIKDKIASLQDRKGTLERQRQPLDDT